MHSTIELKEETKLMVYKDQTYGYAEFEHNANVKQKLTERLAG